MPELRLTHGLKEVDPVIEALLRGEQFCLLRKGGMGDTGFELESDRFLFLPTRKSKKRGRYDRYEDLLTDERFDVEHIRAGGVATGVDRYLLSPDDYPDALVEDTLFTRRGVEKLLSFRPERPLSVVHVRAHRVDLDLEMREEYGGCTSWFELNEPVKVEPDPVADEERFRDEVAAMRKALSGYEA